MSKDSEARKAWLQVVRKLREEGAGASLEAYLADTEALRSNGEVLTVQVPNAFVKEKLTREFSSRIAVALASLEPGLKAVEYLVKEDASGGRAPAEETAAPVPPASEPHPAAGIQNANLNPEYTMDAFIVGKSNAYPHALAKSVSMNPGKNYNPVYFYGGVGLGKTHLMQAIGHELLRNNPKARVLYVSSEVFHNEYIDHIQNKKDWVKFRAKYRNVDCLLIDDVQFLESGERIQDEFFHTFNALREARKQIVLSCDKQPNELKKVEERLRSRFASGVVADLMPPDLEMRIAILKSREVEENVNVPDEVIRYIAERVSSNIRELRAVFRTVVAKSSVLGLPLSILLVEETLRSTTGPQKPQEITIQMVQDEVCAVYGIRKDELVGRRRERRIVGPRQVAMYLARDLAGKTLMEIGEAFGKKDHTTVLHSCSKVESDLKTDSTLKENVERLRIRLREKLA
jgi:chromosomal replication initiator protein